LRDQRPDDDAPFVFVKVGDEERRMRWAEWDALPAWTGPHPARTAKDKLRRHRGNTGQQSRSIRALKVERLH
jgi:hypothetical protein